MTQERHHEIQLAERAGQVERMFGRQQFLH
jgi:hypothetical protein